MQWAHAVRLDLPEEASARETRWLAAAFVPMVAALEGSATARASAAISGAAIRAFERHGCGALLERVGRLAGKRQLELAATAMHDAILPLLPATEIRRQLALSDDENRRVFGEELYRPATLWSPHLATSGYLEQVLAEAGYTVLLVEEHALPHLPWPTDRLPTSAAFPGLTLVPTVHEACVSMRRGRLGYRQLLSIRPPPPDVSAASIVTACDLSVRGATPRAFLEGARGDRLVRIVDVVERLPSGEAVTARACSTSAGFEGLSEGRPFARWFRPQEALNERQWALATLAAEACEGLRRAGLTAVPAVRTLRRVVDLSWRARFFEPGLPAGLRAQWIEALSRAADGVRGLVSTTCADSLEEISEELGVLVRGDGHHGPAHPSREGPQPSP